MLTFIVLILAVVVALAWQAWRLHSGRERPDTHRKRFRRNKQPWE